MLVITGGAGFIGSNLVHALNAAGRDDLVIVDDFTDGDKCRNLARARFLDLWDRDDLPWRLDDLDDVDAVLHQGACSSTTETDGAFLLRNNIDYSKHLIRWCLEHEVPCLHASSASVYGDGERGFREDPDCEEPLNPYAFSKWVIDQWIRRLPASASQLVSLRYFNVYGPNEAHKNGQFSPMMHFHRQIAEHGEIRLFAGSEDFRRDFIAVDDVCAVVLWCLEHPEVSGIANCGTGEARIMQGHYAGAAITEVPFPPHLEGKYQAFTRADISVLRSWGYTRPFTTLEAGIGDYVAILQRDGGLRR